VGAKRLRDNQLPAPGVAPPGEGKAKGGGLVRVSDLRQRRRPGPTLVIEREDVDRIGPFDGHDQRRVIRREPNLARGAWKGRGVEPAPKLIGGEGTAAGVTVQETPGTAAGIEGLRGVGKQPHLAIGPQLEPSNVGGNVTDGIEARPARIEHVEQVVVDGQTGGKQAARGDAIHEPQTAIRSHMKRRNRPLMAVAKVCAIHLVLGEAFGIDGEETTLDRIKHQGALRTKRIRRVQLDAAPPTAGANPLQERQRPVAGPAKDDDLVVAQSIGHCIHRAIRPRGMWNSSDQEANE
jgi:hypothetical protein